MRCLGEIRPSEIALNPEKNWGSRLLRGMIPSTSKLTVAPWSFLVPGGNALAEMSGAIGQERQPDTGPPCSRLGTSPVLLPGAAIV